MASSSSCLASLVILLFNGIVLEEYDVCCICWEPGLESPAGVGVGVGVGMGIAMGVAEYEIADAGTCVSCGAVDVDPALLPDLWDIP